MHSNCTTQLQDSQFTTRAYGSGLTLFFLTSCIIKSYEGLYQYNSFRPIAISNRWAFLKKIFYWRPSTKSVHKVAVSTEFNFHQPKKDVSVVVVVCRKTASLFRGTFCFMRLTDIPLCIWLCLFCVAHWFNKKTPSNTIKRCTVFRGIQWRDDCYTPDTFFFLFSFFFLWQRIQPLFYDFILQMVYSAVK